MDRLALRLLVPVMLVVHGVQSARCRADQRTRRAGAARGRARVDHESGERHRVLESCFLGDSLTAGYGLDKDESVPLADSEAPASRRDIRTKSSTPVSRVTRPPAASAASTGRSRAM